MMMSPIQTSWLVTSWSRLDADPPASALVSKGSITIDGQTHTLVPELDAAWKTAHTRYGAQITDLDRHVVYRATVDERGELDHLEVVCQGHIDDNAMRRVPVARIRRAAQSEALEQTRLLREEGERQLLVTLPGGVEDAATKKRGTVPPLEEIAQQITEKGLGRQQLAIIYERPIRTVDRWITKARKQGLLPPAPQAKRGPVKLVKVQADDTNPKTTN